MPGSFYDSNVLLYLATADQKKADRVENLLRAGGTISVQVLNEITHAARRKFGMSWMATMTLLFTARSHLVVIPLTIGIHESGLSLAGRHKLSIYDALIIAAALEAGCDRLWSEDLQHGMMIESRLRIANPFRAEA